MIKFVKIAYLIGVYAVFARAEAEYLDPSFEINTSGYLYNIGARRYIGIEPAKKVDLVAIKDAKKALRLRAYLNENASDSTIVFLEDKEIPIPEKPGLSMKGTDLYKQKGLKVCSFSKRAQVILDKYNGSNQFGIFVTPPVLLNENAFYLKKGDLCISVDSQTGGISAKGCQLFGTKYRNNQLFAWVDASTYNRGIDPVTYRPEPLIYSFDEYKGESNRYVSETKTHRTHSLKHSHINNPSSLAYSNPYRPY